MQGENKNNLIEEYRIVVMHMSTLKNTYEEKNANELVNTTDSIAFDIAGNKKDTIKFCDSLNNHINAVKNSSFKSIYTDRKDFYIFNYIYYR